LIGIIVGGVLPAIAFGVSGVFAKISNNQSGIGIGLYLMIMGVAIIACGAIVFLILPDKSLSMKSGTAAFASGFVWAMGAGGVAIALSRFGSPLSVLVPLYNANTLVAVLLGLWIFAEWKQVKSVQLLIGSALILVGAVTVARS
jgi:transporter family protein